MSFFDRHARDWDALRADMFGEAVRDAALARVSLGPRAVAVDVGAGTGFLTEALARRSAEVHAVDRSEEMLAVAREKLADLANVEYHVADGVALPLPDATADAVLANMYLHHVEDPPVALAEMVRVLRPGGRLVITDMDRHEHEWLREEQDDVWLGFEREAIRGWLTAAGLDSVTVEDTAQTCCAESATGEGPASVTVFVAAGTRNT